MLLSERAVCGFGATGGHRKIAGMARKSAFPPGRLHVLVRGHGVLRARCAKASRMRLLPRGAVPPPGVML